MIHVGALPGTPLNTLGPRELVAAAVRQARLYRECGVDGIMIENMHDRPYLNKRVGPEIVAAMAVLARAVKEEFGGPVGAQILAGANSEALAVAHAAELQFIRVEAFCYAHVADEGLMNSSAGELLRFRRTLGAESVAIWADIKKKHASHAITSDVSLEETARTAEFMKADAVIVSGISTGSAPELNHLVEARRSTRIPVLIGSGATLRNVETFRDFADGFIVGSEFKVDGEWEKEIDPDRVICFLKKLRQE